MKLSRLYSNLAAVFPPICFNDGLNVVLAEIRNPENLKKDTHNLGKTTIAYIIDFCLLRKKHKEFFLFKHEDIFKGLVFFLEIKLDNGKFMTIRRSVSESSKISILYAWISCPDANNLPGRDWNHWELSFEKSKEVIEGQLDFSVAKGWSFRNPLGYALRLQGDYSEVFHLGKFLGKHEDWKPFLAEIVGLNGEIVKNNYTLNDEIKNIKGEISKIEKSFKSNSMSRDQLEGIIQFKMREIQDLEQMLNNFDFRLPDEEISEEIVNKIEFEIAENNERRYHLQMMLKKIDKTLGESIQFDLATIERVFEDANIYFGVQIKKDYSDLMSFLESISKEREDILKQDRQNIIAELNEIEHKLEKSNNQRMIALATLRQAKSMEKYREHTKKLVELKANLAVLERQREEKNRLVELQSKLTITSQKRNELIQAIEDSISNPWDKEIRYLSIRFDFGDIVKAVIDRSALLSCEVNKEGNIDFRADILDESGLATSADDGHTYRKLLCVAFDIALFSSYLNENFIHFVFHDGVFESLDDRKKQCLLDEIRARCERGLQQIITVIDSDLPLKSDGSRMTFHDSEIVRLLHDQGDDGRLFRMPAW